jgi:hypothetical protein
VIVRGARLDRTEQPRVCSNRILRQADKMELSEAALRTRVTGLGGAMEPARSLGWLAQCALASEIALADSESRFGIARLGRRREQRKSA